MNIHSLKGDEHIAILGAGISGLALAWFLKRKYKSQLKISIFEKENRVGGWIETDTSQGFLFEQGPRSFRSAGAGAATLRLLRSLGLEDQIIFPDKGASKRFIYINGELEQATLSPFSLYGRKALMALLKEPFIGKSGKEDETVASFFNRRVGPFVTRTMVDAMATGIYAGKIDRLSMRACFPTVWNWEQERGSIILGMLRNKGKKEIPHSLFSLKEGAEQLTKALQAKLMDNLWLNAPVESIRPEGEQLLVKTPQVTIKADWVFSTLPAHALVNAIDNPYLGNLLRCIPYTTVAVVNLGYKRKVTEREGFGYLIPSSEKEGALGVVWDSSIFPQQNRHNPETRLTVMIGGANHPELFHLDDSQYVKLAIKSVQKQMGILFEPDAVGVKVAHSAIPQYQVGHHTLLSEIEGSVAAYSPRLKLLGSSFYGVSVNDCIAQAEKLIDVVKF